VSLAKYINKTSFQVIVAIAFVIALISVPALVVAQSGGPDLSTGGIGGSLKEGSVAVDPDNEVDTAGETVNDTIRLVINAFSWIVGIISVIMIIVGGVKYITSSGDSGNVTGAKNTILYAIIGLVIVAMAQIIVQFVLGQVLES
jgi:uncharacterized membrane protein YidH (DUF202 family)